MTIGTTNVVAPVFAAAEIVVLFPSRVTTETSLRDLFRRLVLERNNFLGIAFFRMSFARSVTRLAARDLVFPATDLC